MSFLLGGLRRRDSLKSPRQQDHQQSRQQQQQQQYARQQPSSPPSRRPSTIDEHPPVLASSAARVVPGPAGHASSSHNKAAGVSRTPSSASSANDSGCSSTSDSATTDATSLASWAGTDPSARSPDRRWSTATTNAKRQQQELAGGAPYLSHVVVLDSATRNPRRRASTTERPSLTAGAKIKAALSRAHSLSHYPRHQSTAQEHPPAHQSTSGLTLAELERAAALARRRVEDTGVVQDSACTCRQEHTRSSRQSSSPVTTSSRASSSTDNLTTHSTVRPSSSSSSAVAAAAAATATDSWSSRAVARLGLIVRNSSDPRALHVAPPSRSPTTSTTTAPQPILIDQGISSTPATRPRDASTASLSMAAPGSPETMRAPTAHSLGSSRSSSVATDMAPPALLEDVQSTPTLEKPSQLESAGETEAPVVIYERAAWSRRQHTSESSSSTTTHRRSSSSSRRDDLARPSKRRNSGTVLRDDVFPAARPRLRVSTDASALEPSTSSPRRSPTSTSAQASPSTAAPPSPDTARSATATRRRTGTASIWGAADDTHDRRRLIHQQHQHSPVRGSSLGGQANEAPQSSSDSAIAADEEDAASIVSADEFLSMSAGGARTRGLGARARDALDRVSSSSSSCARATPAEVLAFPSKPASSRRSQSPPAPLTLTSEPSLVSQPGVETARPTARMTSSPSKLTRKSRSRSPSSQTEQSTTFSLDGASLANAGVTDGSMPPPIPPRRRKLALDMNEVPALDDLEAAALFDGTTTPPASTSPVEMSLEQSPSAEATAFAAMVSRSKSEPDVTRSMKLQRHRSSISSERAFPPPMRSRLSSETMMLESDKAFYDAIVSLVTTPVTTAPSSPTFRTHELPDLDLDDIGSPVSRSSVEDVVLENEAPTAEHQVEMRQLFQLREIMRTERHYERSLTRLLQNLHRLDTPRAPPRRSETTSSLDRRSTASSSTASNNKAPYITLLQEHLSRLISLSNRLSAAFELDPTAHGVASAFLACAEDSSLSDEFVAWHQMADNFMKAFSSSKDMVLFTESLDQLRAANRARKTFSASSLPSLVTSGLSGYAGPSSGNSSASGNHAGPWTASSPIFGPGSFSSRKLSKARRREFVPVMSHDGQASSGASASREASPGATSGSSGNSLPTLSSIGKKSTSTSVPRTKSSGKIAKPTAPGGPSKDPCVGDILIQPIQRVPRYQMLFTELLKTTPVSTEAHALVRQCALTAQGLARVCNDTVQLSTRP